MTKYKHNYKIYWPSVLFKIVAYIDEDVMKYSVCHLQFLINVPALIIEQPVLTSFEIVYDKYGKLYVNYLQL